MKIIKSYAKMINFVGDNFYLSDGIRLLRHCEAAARISHRSEDKMTENSYDRLLRFIVLEHGDFSVIEHASVTVEAVVDRGITHEWVRHRLGAYTQESTRFVNYNKKMEPSFIRPSISNDGGQGGLGCDFVGGRSWDEIIEKMENMYKHLVSCGVSPQLARSVLPNALASKIWITYNLRMWRHFFLMRTSKETHPQFREVTIPLLKEFKDKIPILYADIVPESKQSNNMRMMR